jgi:PAS domain S-box-containing protein
MDDRMPHEKLKKRIRVLEDEVAKLRQVEQKLRESKERMELALQGADQGMWDWDIQTGKVVTNDRLAEMLGYRVGEIKPKLGAWKKLIHKEDVPKVENKMNAHLEGSTPFYVLEYRMQAKSGDYIWISDRGKVIERDEDGKALRMSGTHLDITERKLAEQALQAREMELENQAHNLEEANTALKVLIKHREEDKKELEEKIVANVKDGIFPFIDKIRMSSLNDRQTAYIEIIKSLLDDIISPFYSQLSSEYTNLTPTEIQVAGLIKEGKTTKEIADLLNLSAGTIEFHRNNMRKKLGLRNTKTNLRSFLLSIK